MVKIPNETRRRRCPTWNARRCAFWGFEKIHIIYTYKRLYRMCVCVCVFIYIYMGSEYIPIKTERKTLAPPPPPATRLLPSNHKKSCWIFSSLTRPSTLVTSVQIPPSSFVRFFLCHPLPAPRSNSTFPIGGGVYSPDVFCLPWAMISPASRVQ